MRIYTSHNNVISVKWQKKNSVGPQSRKKLVLIPAILAVILSSSLKVDQNKPKRYTKWFSTNVWHKYLYM